MKTLASLFSGGGLFDIGAGQAGYETIWGIEIDPHIALTARGNRLPISQGDVRFTDWSLLRTPDHLHASPPCPHFSLINTKGKGTAKESVEDIEMAWAIVIALATMKPHSFTLENVPQYHRSASFAIVFNTVQKMFPNFVVQTLDSADHFVPQTRKRLWLRASHSPLKAHCDTGPRLGWFQAVEDLIPSFPEDHFAPWQLKRLPENLQTLLMPGSGSQFKPSGAGNGHRLAHEPAHAVTSDGGGRVSRAFIAAGGSASRGIIPVRMGDEPAFTIKANADTKEPVRGLADGKVVRITLQGLARFQTVPDSYSGLTGKINGNGVPCKLAQTVMESF